MNKLIVLYCLFANLFLSSCLQKDPVVTGQASVLTTGKPSCKKSSHY